MADMCVCSPVACAMLGVELWNVQLMLVGLTYYALYSCLELHSRILFARNRSVSYLSTKWTQQLWV